MSRTELLALIDELNELLVEATTLNEQRKITAELIKYNSMLRSAK